MKIWSRRFAILSVVALPGVAAADLIIDPGSYALRNHPDGGTASQHYGLRLDELFDVTGKHDIFTFDFDAPRSSMWLDFSGSSVHIYGTVFGGRDVGGAYGGEYAGMWVVDFTYGGAGAASGDDDIVVAADTFPNAGSITRLDTGEVIPLFDYSGSRTYTLRVGDEDNDDGYRGYSGISGWGWIDQYASGTSVLASNWLFTLDPTPVPEPTAVVLGGLGLLAVLGLRRRGE